jgi:hypothetical protein
MMTMNRIWFALISATAVVLTMVASSPAGADDGGGEGGCNVYDPSCTVGTGGGGSSGGGGGDGGGGSAGDPCAKWPNATYGSKPPAVSQACADALQGRFCDAIKADALGGLQAGSFAVLPIAEIDALNKQFVAAGCPPVVTPATLAEQAYKTIRFPHPSGSRSPSQNLLYRGYPFTYVMLQTFYWTDLGSWKTLSATASAGGLTATVTARPTQLIFDPGDGSSAVSCAGPGRPWTNADGNDPPTGEACAYQYTKVTASPITSTQSIVWKITWTGTGNTGGEIPQLVTSTSGQLNVMQIQTVVTQ